MTSRSDKLNCCSYAITTTYRARGLGEESKSQAPKNEDDGVVDQDERARCALCATTGRLSGFLLSSIMAIPPPPLEPVVYADTYNSEELSVLHVL
jgi:hypothetical protein